MSSNPVYRFFSTPGSLAPLFLRLLLAVIFFYHGMQKLLGWFGGDGWHKTIELWSKPEAGGIPFLFAAMAIALEVLISLSLFLGLFTRLAALGVIVIMGGALFYFYPGASFSEIEYPLAILTIGLALLFIGGGALSMDRGISGALLPSVG